MVPKQLTLKNFLSYCDARLDFAGLHIACVCGPNGAGKSSLLEAMTWAVWGQGRGTNEDDVIHLGESEAQVDFMFEHRQQLYRIIRSRRRRQHSSLEFQIDTESGFRSLTQRGLRATQQLILQHLRIDYETFIHSAYLRQGQADEFMLKRPAERKQILADLLKLSQYDDLADRAKEQARDHKALAAAITASLATLEQRLAQRSEIQTQHQQVQQQLATLRDRLSQATTQHNCLQQQMQQRQELLLRQHDQQQRLSWLQQQLAQQQRIQQRLQRQTQQIAAIRSEKETLLQHYAEYQQLQTLEEAYIAQSQTYRALQTQLTEVLQSRSQTLAPLFQQQRQQQQQLDVLNDQCKDLQHSLEERTEIQAALAQLQAAKAHLEQIDRRQLTRAPLLQQRQILQLQIQRTKVQLSAQLEAITSTQQQLTEHQHQQPQLQQAVADLSRQIDYLEQRRLYQEQVRLKGQERRSFMEKLQADQRVYETQLAQLAQKLALLDKPDASCPLCQRPLKDHSDRIRQRYQQEYDDIQNQIWVTREQLAVSEREIQVLRQEYRDIEAELYPYAATLEQRGQLQAQLAARAESAARLATLEARRRQLERCLQGDSTITPLQQEAQQLDEQLAQLDYDERDHALARNQVEKLRWAEVRQAELERVERRLTQLQSQLPQLRAQLEATTAEVETLERSLTQQKTELEQQKARLNYHPDEHHQVRQQLRQQQQWQVRYQALLQAEERQPELTQQLAENTTAIEALVKEVAEINTQLDHLDQRLAALPDPTSQLAELETHIKVNRSHCDTQLAQQGRLEQQLSQLDTDQALRDQQLREQQSHQHQQRVYQELAHAFSKNGLQTLMIENLLPQLEAETNHLLGRLSNHQLHVQFVTQRAGRSRNKLIDTLDILIADTRGTRPYETYSGGEAFRVNFAIRLALARLLAHRSGMALQMLIIDEGFGTQDQAGCNRLVAAINAIAPDFACILAVTHMPHFREAFQTRIDVNKTERGSQLALSA
ncbi:MAG: SMC family ATPase [Cyanobacteria bacterium P01_D01_bin.14]